MVLILVISFYVFIELLFCEYRLICNVCLEIIRLKGVEIKVNKMTNDKDKLNRVFF